MICKFRALNGSQKEVDFSKDGWKFVSQFGMTNDFRRVMATTEWIATRKHCGGSLIVRFIAKTPEIMLHELTEESAINWLSYNQFVGIPWESE
jgi:hypothetical protein